MPDAITAAADPQGSGFAREQLLFLGRQANRVPLPVMALAAFIAAISWESGAVPTGWIVSWVATLAALQLLRFVYSRDYLARGIPDPAAAATVMSWISFCNGAVTALAGVVLLPRTHLGWQAIVTTVLVSACAGAIPASACRARSYYLYTTPMLVTLAVTWIAAGAAEPGWINVLIAMLLLMYLAICAAFIRDTEKMFRDSFETRFENLRLIEQLQNQKNEVLRQRDLAEEANRAKSRFLASASHDLRQPLHAISLCSAVLDMQPVEPATREICQRIGEGIDSLAALLDGLLDISKLDSQVVAPIPDWLDLNELIEHLCAEARELAYSRGARLLVQTDQTPCVRTDRLLLERIVRNLIDNAIKHGAPGTVRLLDGLREDRAFLKVIDDGPGIAVEDQERVFEEFFQLNNPERDRSRGLGLGLAIVRRLSQLLAIECRLESTPGRGTTFTLTFDTAASAPALPDRPVPKSVPESATALAGASVLVVEDDAPVRLAMRTLLTGWGCRVAESEGLDDALAQLERSPFDLLVADYRLRNGARGIDLLGIGHGDAPPPAMIIVTGDTSATVLQSLESEGVGYLFKPVDPARLLRKLIEMHRLQLDARDQQWPDVTSSPKAQKN